VKGAAVVCELFCACSQYAAVCLLPSAVKGDAFPTKTLGIDRIVWALQMSSLKWHLSFWRSLNPGFNPLLFLWPDQRSRWQPPRPPKGARCRCWCRSSSTRWRSSTSTSRAAKQGRLSLRWEHELSLWLQKKYERSIIWRGLRMKFDNSACGNAARCPFIRHFSVSCLMQTTYRGNLHRCFIVGGGLLLKLQPGVFSSLILVAINKVPCSKR
jgi:hypothetical protein